jgi:hypothetical protein
VENADSKKWRTGSVLPFTKMAAAANSKVFEMVFFGHFSLNSDEY